MFNGVIKNVNSSKYFLGLLLCGVFLFACSENIESQNYSDLSSEVKKSMKANLNLAKEDDKSAQLLLSHMYLGRMQDLDYPLDQEKGVYWLEKFAEEQHPLIQEKVGENFHYGTDGVEKDLNKAFKWYLKASEQGLVSTMDYLGIFYSNGYGDLEQSCEKAVEWFEKSYAGGYRFAANNIAWEYATCPFEDFRDGEKALRLALEVVELDASESSTHLDTLAAAYAENDDFENAIKTQRKALGLIDKDKSEDRFQDFLKRLMVYKNGDKWRAPLKGSNQVSDNGI